MSDKVVDVEARIDIAALSTRVSAVEQGQRDTHDGIEQLKVGMGELLAVHNYEVRPTQELAKTNRRDIDEIRPKVNLTQKALEEIRSEREATANQSATMAVEKLKANNARVIAIVSVLGPLLALIISHFLGAG